MTVRRGQTEGVTRVLVDIPPRFIRSAVTDEAATIRGALVLLEELASVTGRRDLDGVDLLDVGCGVKFTQAILNHGLAIGSYVGVDVFADMVGFLQRSVDDPRFTYHHIDVANELYNPDAPPLTAATDLGVGDRTFDLVSLYSVFTHLNPADYAAMLHVVRRSVRPGGRLVFTAFLDEPTEGGHSLTDFRVRVHIEDVRRSGGEPQSVDEARAARTVVPFVDVDPSRPLTYALYSREHALELVDGTGWQVDLVLEPTVLRQHLFVCSPI